MILKQKLSSSLTQKLMYDNIWDTLYGESLYLHLLIYYENRTQYTQISSGKQRKIVNIK